MTTLLNHRPLPGRLDTTAWTIGAPRLLAGLQGAERLDLPAHLSVHGPLPGTDRERLLAHVEAVGLAGRGGAAFPLATKIRALAAGRRQVIVNGTESEPASRKDRTLLRRAPHLVLDGALAVAAAVEARDLVVAVHDEQAAAAVRAALAERSDARRARVAVRSGGFVAGEARAVVRALGGGPPVPPGRRTPPTAAGVLLGNVETFAQVAVLLRLGPHRFAETGTPDEPGTTLLTVGGAVARPAVLEIPLGTPLGIVLSAARAGDVQAVVAGGHHGAWIHPVPDIRISRAGLAAAGGSLGAGVLLAVGADTCALGELARVADWLAAESARQCGPCAFGLPALATDVRRVRDGRLPAVASALEHAHTVTGRGACAHPDGAARFVGSALHVLREETERHLRGGCGRPVLGHLPVGGA